MSSYATCRMTVTNSGGDALPNATVHVYQPGTTTPVAGTLYSDNALTQTLPNPLTSDSFGGIVFYMADVQYVDLAVSLPGFTTRTIADVLIASATIVDGSITTAMLADDAVTTAKIADAAITSAKASLSTASATLATDVTMTNANTFYDGPSVSLAAGTWLVTAWVTVHGSGTGGDNITAKLWDGTTVVASGGSNVIMSSVSQGSVTVAAIVTLGSTATYKISAALDVASGVIKAATPVNGAGNNASGIVAIRVA